MKRDKMLSSFDLIDEKYIEEASPQRQAPKRRFWVKFGAIAACIGIMISSLSLWLFLPFDTSPPDVSQYSDSEYYPLIQKLNALTYKKPKAKNNFQLYFSSPFRLFSSIKDNASAEGMLSGGASNDVTEDMIYSDVTDNQVAGVTEADLFKRSESHIFYLRGNTLSVYSIAGADSECVSTYTITTGEGHSVYNYGIEAYLTDDSDTFTVIIPRFDSKLPMTDIIALDVSDPENISQRGMVSVAGYYVSSRLSNGKLIMITNFGVSYNFSFDDEKSYIPYTECNGETRYVPMNDITLPDDPTNTSYTVVGMFDPESLESVGSRAYLSYSQSVYASTDSLYLTRRYTESFTADGITTDRVMTDISRLGYSGDSLEYKGTMTVEGYVLDQYSLDERDGILRVVTTTDTATYEKKSSLIDPDEFYFSSSGNTNANLYCIDIESCRILASVEHFAPDGETVRSARFDGDTAYVCTSIQLSDPVFFFDLSSLDSITVKDTGTVEGFSSSLVDFADGYLLGIGVGDLWDTVKIEVYAEGESTVESVCKYEMKYSSYSTVYKSYLIDRDNSLVGLEIYYHGPSARDYYLLLHFDGEKLIPIIETPIVGDYALTRAANIDGWIYIFSSNEFKVLPLPSLG